VKLLIDMNLSPEWVPYLHERGFEAVHWASVGAHDAPDTEIMQWARDNGRVVFTHDLDFGILLAHSKDGRPSVIQVRAQDVSPDHLGSIVVTALRAHGDALESGALVTIDEAKSRVRILPI
jgi:predicted nuclease of predicted toxin-antitoxin system